MTMVNNNQNASRLIFTRTDNQFRRYALNNSLNNINSYNSVRVNNQNNSDDVIEQTQRVHTYQDLVNQLRERLNNNELSLRERVEELNRVNNDIDLENERIIEEENKFKRITLRSLSANYIENNENELPEHLVNTYNRLKYLNNLKSNKRSIEDSNDVSTENNNVPSLNTNRRNSGESNEVQVVTTQSSNVDSINVSNQDEQLDTLNRVDSNTERLNSQTETTNSLLERLISTLRNEDPLNTINPNSDSNNNNNNKKSLFDRLEDFFKNRNKEDSECCCDIGDDVLGRRRRNRRRGTNNSRRSRRNTNPRNSFRRDRIRERANSRRTSSHRPSNPRARLPRTGGNVITAGTEVASAGRLSGLGNIGSKLGGAAKFAGKAAPWVAAAFAAKDFYDGFDSQHASDLGFDPNSITGKSKSGISSAVSGLTLGIVDEDTVASGIKIKDKLVGKAVDAVGGEDSVTGKTLKAVIDPITSLTDSMDSMSEYFDRKNKQEKHIEVNSATDTQAKKQLISESVGDSKSEDTSTFSKLMSNTKNIDMKSLLKDNPLLSMLLMSNPTTMPFGVNGLLTSSNNPLSGFFNKLTSSISGSIGGSFRGNGPLTSYGNSGDGSNVDSSSQPGSSKAMRAADIATKRASGRGSTGDCAKFVADALEQSGYKFTRQNSAYMYHSNGTMRSMGFSNIANNSPLKKGDVQVWPAHGVGKKGGAVHGHIAIYNGSNWVSDFIQNSELVNPSYKRVAPSLYRDLGTGPSYSPTQDKPKTLGGQAVVGMNSITSLGRGINTPSSNNSPSKLLSLTKPFSNSSSNSTKSVINSPAKNSNSSNNKSSDKKSSVSGGDLDSLMDATYSKYGFNAQDKKILKAQIWKESKFDPNATNKRTGAAGLAQFMPATAKQYRVNPYDPASAIDGQARYMKDLLSASGGNWKYALAGYNAGPGDLKSLDRERKALGEDDGNGFKETKDYVSIILGKAGQSGLIAGNIGSALGAAGGAIGNAVAGVAARVFPTAPVMDVDPSKVFGNFTYTVDKKSSSKPAPTEQKFKKPTTVKQEQALASKSISSTVGNSMNSVSQAISSLMASNTKSANVNPVDINSDHIDDLALMIFNRLQLGNA